VFAREPNNANAYELMGAMMQQGRSKEAIAALKSQQRWLNTSVLLLLGSVWVVGNITGLMTLKKAAQVDPRNVKSTYRWARILRAQNDLDGALSASGSFDCATQFSRSRQLSVIFC